MDIILRRKNMSNNMNSFAPIIILILFLAIFYFLMIRPENKRKKAAEAMRSKLAVGDNITTIGGLVGKVVHVDDNFVVFETGEDRVRIKIQKNAVNVTPSK